MRKTFADRCTGILTVALFCVAAMQVSAQIQHTVTFSPDDVSITQDTIDGTRYSRVSYSGLINVGNPGEPSLPVKCITFSVPYNAYNISVTATVNSSTAIVLPSIVFPEQEPRSMSDTTAVVFTQPDNTVYGSSSIYPAATASIVNEGFLEGDNHLVGVAVYPASYNPESEELRINTSITLNITYTTGSGSSALEISPILRQDTIGRGVSIANVKSLVANPGQVNSNLAPLAIVPASTDTTSGYEYCVVTSRALAPAFQRLVALRKQKGYDAGIVCMEDILANPLFQSGDIVSGINDDAGKLRAYLMYAFQNHGTKYVLLGGKEPHVPIRYGYRSNNAISSDYIIPTDLYFSDISSNWDSDSDQRYGEPVDSIDLYHDLYVGRLLCSSIEDVTNYIDKLLRYEFNPGNGDYSYLERSFLSYSYSMNNSDWFTDKNLENDITQIESIIYSVFPEHTKILQDESFPSGKYIIDKVNEIKPFYTSFHGHGNPEGVQVADIKSKYPTLANQIVYGVNALDAEVAHHAKEDGNGLDCLSDNYYPGIMYSMSCITMPYDKYPSNNPKILALTKNFGESYTLGKNYGGVAYLGNTRVGYLYTSTLLEKLFLKELNEGNTIISSAESCSKIELVSLYAVPTYHNNYHVRLAHNLLGDPLIDVWTGIPTVFNASTMEVFRDETGIITITSYNGVPVGCYVAVIEPDGNIIKQNFQGSSSDVVCSPNSAVMIYGHNIIPYFPDLLIQKENYENSQYLFAGSVKIGKLADANRSSGNVVFKAGADITIDASGDVLLGSGVIVESGAALTVKSRGTVKIADCVVKSGGSLTVESNETSVAPSFEAESGAVINIKPLSN